jgi:hypothetical protein
MNGMLEKGNVNKVLLGEPTGKNAPQKPTHIGKDNINISHRDVGLEDGGRWDRWSGAPS